MPSGPGPIPDSLIRDIAETVPPAVATFLLTCETTAKPIIAQQRYCRTNTIQLVDAVVDGVHDALRDALPGISLVQVIHVRDEIALREAVDVSGKVDAILLDSGQPTLAVKQLGGTGGLIAIDKNGEIASPFNTTGMYRGYVDPKGKFVVEIYK